MNVWHFNYIFGWLIAVPTFAIINWEGVIGIYFAASDYIKRAATGGTIGKNNLINTF